jgi:hypothetical protein
MPQAGHAPGCSNVLLSSLQPQGGQTYSFFSSWLKPATASKPAEPVRTNSLRFIFTPFGLLLMENCSACVNGAAQEAKKAKKFFLFSLPFLLPAAAFSRKPLAQVAIGSPTRCVKLAAD